MNTFFISGVTVAASLLALQLGGVAAALAVGAVIVLVGVLVSKANYSDTGSGSRSAQRGVERLVNYAAKIRSDAVNLVGLGAVPFTGSQPAVSSVPKAETYTRDNPPALSQNARNILDEVYRGARELKAKRAALRKDFGSTLTNGAAPAGGIRNPPEDRTGPTLDVRIAAKLAERRPKSTS